MAWIDGIGQAITAFIGLSNGRVIQTQQFTSELGFGHGIDGLGEVPEHLRQLVEEWQRMPTATRAQDVKREMTQAGRLEGQALMMKGLGDARIKKIKAATSMGKTKLKVDLATFQAGSQLAQAQAQNLDTDFMSSHHMERINRTRRLAAKDRKSVV